MALTRLKVESLRCLDSVDIRLNAGRNYVFGPNGAGKTSVLESVHLLGRGRSFRTRQTERLVQRGKAGLTVHGAAKAGGHSVRLGVSFEERRLTVRVGGRETGTASLARELPVHVIDPRLHQLVEAGPSERRRYLDWGVFHVERDYLSSWRRYRRLLGQRNAALKRQSTRTELSAWTEPLVELGEEITAQRRRYVEGLGAALSATAVRLLGRRVEAAYYAGWRAGVGFAEALEEAGDRERESVTTPIGPHRADLVLEVEGTPVRDEVSRGQQKLVAAALVLAQVDQLGSSEAEKSVLLVDDPAAELDARALERLMAEVYARPVQLIVTALAPEALQPQPGYPVFHVEQGQVRSMV